MKMENVLLKPITCDTLLVKRELIFKFELIWLMMRARLVEIYPMVSGDISLKVYRGQTSNTK
jgi:hypothetical protein